MFPQLFHKKVCEKGRKGIYPQGRGARSLRVFSLERGGGLSGGGGAIVVPFRVLNRKKSLSSLVS